MAGIGFELKKVIQKGNLGSFIKAALSGIMIVAGPWIVSIVTIIIIKRIAGLAFLEMPQLFIAVIVYTYSFSLIIFGGFHYIYTRLVADLMFVKENRKAASLLLFFSLCIGSVSAVIAGIAVSFINPDIRHLFLFKLSFVVLFTSVNIIWLLMLFISLVTWYGKIFITYLAGMGIAIGAVFLLGNRYYAAGALLGFTIGHLFILILLFVIAFSAYKPIGLFTGSGLILPYVKKYKSLFLTGYLYHLGLWIDKIVFWFTIGTSVPGTFFRLYEPYDMAVYLCTLTMIPGLVFFIIFSEPSFYIYVKKFLLALTKSKLRSIRQKKYLMFNEMKQNLKDQSLFQGVITVTGFILIPLVINLFPEILVSTVMMVTLGGVFFHLLLLTSVNLHFYLEFYRHTYRACLLFTVLNGAGAAAIVFFNLTAIAGLNYLIATVIAASYSLFMFMREGKKADRYILSGVRIM